MDDALKEIFGPLFEGMLQGEMNHLGYESNQRAYKETENRRNGYGEKTVRTTKGEMEIEVPRN